MTPPLVRRAYVSLSGWKGGAEAADLDPPARGHQPRNFFLHALSLAATKTGDGLADPKLVLSWLLGAVGAPTGLVGLLVPIREAGALLPQLVISARLDRVRHRKWTWAAGSAVQGLAVLGMALCAITLDGVAAGVAIVGLLTVFALARSVASVTLKDVFGKTVAGSTRGAASGLSTTISSTLVLGFGIALASGLLPINVATVAGALAVAGVLWLLGAGMFASLAEPASEHSEGKPKGILDQLGYLREDPQLTRFIAARGLMMATALAPPYLLALGAQSTESGLGQLGPFVLASSLAGLLSSYVWGRLADRSSRRVLMLSGLTAALPLSAAAILGWTGVVTGASSLALPTLLFVLMIAYRGVRIGRKIHLVDMAPKNRRAAYTAVSNTLVGALLALGGLFGLVAQFAGVETVLLLFAAMSLAGSAVARGLDEVQGN
ncbi:MFS transporter [Engelhardtia mirabilis]|uniref:Major Facilitator Superfamily protein n=1 Tax=Engelhardtia mirabilis TaxID=2528011 RepID=A0A518BQS5_9BACT|nr:Major Facilitator Superfamily protein [Planctomycetes bacterium Pla133]QDV03632.1 Major Facilitator Superfamily protein [Planctomycetes bacterium Pla86]